MIELAIIGFFALLLISVALAPLEALGWWAGWRGGRRRAEPVGQAEPPPAPAEHYLVYLAGVNAIAGDVIADVEQRFLARLQQSLPGTVVIADVFPYSVTNTGLNGERVFAWLWRRMERLRLRRPGALLAQLIHLRNLFQVAVSADQRYGPIYNFGVSEEILAGLRRGGYSPDRPVPVTLLGWSGGAQIAVGAAPFLVRALDTPVQIISLGGVVAADPGLARVRRLWHLYGTEDRIQRIGQMIFPGRWRIALESPWNRARSEGRLHERVIGPIGHRPPCNYFDDGNRLPDGQTYAERTLESVLEALREGGVRVGPG